MPRPSRHAPDTLARPYDWRADGACREMDPAVFFPKDMGRAAAPLVALEAKAVCAVCPVRQACLRHAMERPEWSGVWGGLDEDERRQYRRRLQRRARRRAARRQKREGGGDAAET
ncbi:WhiB family transcriptional regulator [[Kitasatospora] papulosa]|uniref:WhiB family transcriptional regulator n=1 Tax=[Kitasatospora] papulosa TaxID=1464011 RepID=UPI0036CCE140